MAIISQRTLRVIDLLRAIQSANNDSHSDKSLQNVNNVSDEQLGNLVQKLQSSLDIEEALLVVAYFGLHVGNRLNLDEIRSRYGYTAEQIYCIVAGALKKLEFESIYKSIL